MINLVFRISKSWLDMLINMWKGIYIYIKRVKYGMKKRKE